MKVLEAFSAFQQLSAIEQGAAYVAVGGVVVSLSTLVYGWWQDRQQNSGDEIVVDQMKRSVQERLRKGQMFFSYEEIRRMSAKLLAAELSGLLKKKKITQETHDLFLSEIARCMGMWELYPKPKPCPAPDPVQVKTVIRSRIVGGPIQCLPFPDLKKSSKPRLEDMLLAALRR